MKIPENNLKKGDKMSNLIKETVRQLEDNHKTPGMVKWVGSRDGRYAMPWDEFAKRFSRIEYYSGFGGQEIADDLVVVGEDWWLERHEYDGSEWWEYKALPIRKEDAKPFDKVEGAWDALDTIMNKAEDGSDSVAELLKKCAEDDSTELSEGEKEVLEGMGIDGDLNDNGK